LLKVGMLFAWKLGIERLDGPAGHNGSDR
jgi:hypothetical protein